MKKFVLFAIVALLAAVPVLADDSSSTEIIAIVGENVVISADLPSTTTIDVTLTQAALGTLTVVSNTASAWNIEVSSLHGGHMEGDSTGADYGYTVSLQAPGGTYVLDQVSLSSAQSRAVTPGIGSFVYTLTAQYATAASLGLAADIYRDTITIEVSAN